MNGEPKAPTFALAFAGAGFAFGCGAEAIAAMLRTNRSLTRLMLRSDKISITGKKELGKAVKDRQGVDGRGRSYGFELLV